MSALTTPTKSNKREKKKRRNEQKEILTSDRKPKKGKEQDHMCATEPRNGSKPPENLLNASSKPSQAQTSPPC
jgi:hypothetical protein